MAFIDKFDVCHAVTYLHDTIHYEKVAYKLLIIPHGHLSPEPLKRDDDRSKMSNIHLPM